MRDSDIYGKSKVWQRRWKRGVERMFAPDMKDFTFDVDEVDILMSLDPGQARALIEAERRVAA